MKKVSGKTVCCGVSAILFAGFIIQTAVDYSQYSSTLNSAPFHVWMIANAIELMLPAIILLIIGLALMKKVKK